MPRDLAQAKQGDLCWQSSGQNRYGSSVSPRFVRLALLILSATGAASAEDCYGTHTLGGCFSSLGVAGPAEPGPFRTLSLARTLPYGSLATSLNGWYVSKPAELVVSSPDPAGRSIDVVSRALVVDLRAAFGIGRSLDLTLGLPVYADVNGAGSNAIASQKPTALSGSALGDLRMGVRSTLVGSTQDSVFRLMARNEWTLPTGDASMYAGEVGPTSTTALTGAVYVQGWSAALDIGYRAAPSVRFGDLRLGSAALFGLGIARDIIEPHVLTIGIEAWASSILVDAPTKDVPSQQQTVALPAEWMSNLQLKPRNWAFWFWAGAGSGLSLSSRTTETRDAFADAHFISPSAARMRVGLGVGGIFDALR